MKFLNPKTGEVFEDIESARGNYCIRRDCGCCAIGCKKPTCSDWAAYHPSEAAQLMGFEVVENDIGSVNKAVEEGGMEKKSCHNCGNYESKDGCSSCTCCSDRPDAPSNWNPATKPRICEVLGVEVRERFDTECYKDAFIERDGTVRTNFRCLMDSDRVCEIINHPDRIIRKPRFTEDEKAFLRLIKSTFRWANYIFRNNNRALYFCDKELKMDENGWYDLGPASYKHIPDEFFEGIKPKQFVSIADILGKYAP